MKRETPHNKADSDLFSIDMASFRKLIQSGGEFLKTNVPVEGHPFAKPIPTVILGKQSKTVEKPIPTTRAFFIPGQVPLTKNHKRIYRKRLRTEKQLIEMFKNRENRTKGNTRRDYRYYIGDTEMINNYKKKTAKYYREFAEEFRMESAGMSPVYVEMLFVFKSKTVKWDFASMVQIVQDQMDKHAWIVSNNIMNFCPVPPLKIPLTACNKRNPGVRITVLKFKTDRNSF